MMNTLLAACAFSLMLVGASCLESSEATLHEIEFSEEYLTDGFDFPVGKPDGNGYYNAQVFGKNNHLGDDWNGNGGGNSDLGDSVFAMANGYVNFAKDVDGGWGNVIRILHKLPDETLVESLYAHFEKIAVKQGDWVKRGDFIGTVGTANGIYYAHLHFEIRSDVSMGIGAGYSSDQSGYLDPTKFIREHRP